MILDGAAAKASSWNGFGCAWDVWHWQVLRLRAALPVAGVMCSIAGARGKAVRVGLCVPPCGRLLLRSNIAHNGFGLCVRWGFPALKPNSSTNLNLSTND